MNYYQKIKNNQGQAIVEFTLIAITLIFTILGVIQLALVLNAYSMVHYAAYNAARAAIVHGADKNKMQEAARLSLLSTFPSHGRADNLKGYYQNYLSAKDTDNDPNLTESGKPITRVEILNKNNLACDEVVTFDDPVDAKKAILTVRVVHQYQLVIPMVNRMLYYLYKKVIAGEGDHGETIDNLAAVTAKMEKTGEFQDIEYRIPLVSFYTMRMQSDYVQECS